MHVYVHYLKKTSNITMKTFSFFYVNFHPKYILGHEICLFSFSC